ncbi:hypothetical protein ACTFIZ_005843 [Dictyostelium cf. discoideum]
MLKSTQFALLSMANIQNPRVLQPVQLVLHGNQYLKDLSSNSLKNDFAKRSLESINISLNEPNTNSNRVMNAKDWIHSLHSKGALSLSLSRSSNKKQNTHNNSLLYSTCTPLQTHNTESEFVIVSSEISKAWQFGRDENNESFPLLSPSAISSPKQMEEHLVWRKIMLGEIRERIREAVERMRDFTILNFHKMELSEQQKINFLNQLTEAEKFIHMDVMVTTDRDIEYLFNYLSLPRAYATNSQSRVALQILNAAFSAYIFDNTTKITDPKLNEDFKRLIIELYDSVLDSVICSTNNFNSEY